MRLNRCPFCGIGEKALFVLPCDGVFDKNKNKSHYVECATSDGGCGATGSIGYDYDDAIAWWNGKHMEVDVNATDYMEVDVNAID